jgi:ABC-type amino acid transport substrate-binding protein
MGKLIIPILIAIVYISISALVVAPRAGEALRVAVGVPYPPFAEYDDSGALVGFDVDIARALCKEIGQDCVIVPMPFQEITPSLASGGIDLAVAGMGSTEERKQYMDFTDRYYRSLSIYLERPGTNRDMSPKGMEGKRIGAQKGTLQERYLRQTYGSAVSVVVYENIATLMEMLRQGTLELVLVDGLAGYAYLKSHLGTGLETVGRPIDPDRIAGWACVAVSKKRPGLREKLNQAIQALRRNGEYDRINRRYFDFTVY